MKDPWQSEESAYEVLGLSEQAGEEEVERAFKLAVGRGQKAPQLLAARNALRRPEERAFLDLLRYDVGALGRLLNFPLRPERLAEAAGRAQLAQALLNIQRKAFPHPQASHALAVLYYWSARRTQNQPSDGWIAAPLSPWEAAIAHLVLLCRVLPFWEGWQAAHPGVKGDDLRERLRAHVQGELRTLAESSRRAGQTEQAAAFEDYLLAYAQEERVAGKLEGINAQLRCGPLLLQMMGWLEETRRQVAAAAQRQPGGDWGELLAALSPLGRAQALLDNHQADAALDYLKRLSAEQLKGPEAARLRARAYLEKGQQYAAGGQLIEAMGAWNQARQASPGPEVMAALREVVTAAVHDRARALMEKQPEEAKRLLASALAIVDSKDLHSLQGDLLMQQGWGKVKEALEKRRRPGVSKAELEVLRGGIERAVKEFQRAAPYSETARDLLPRTRRALADWPDIYDADWCWFCGVRRATPAAVHTHDMYRVTERTGNTVRYQTTQLKTPRCAECESRHRLANLVRGLAWVAGTLVGVIGCAAVRNSIANSVIGTGTWINVFFGFFAWRWVSGMIIEHMGTRPQRAFRKTPNYLTAREQNWVEGKRPPTR